LTLFLPPRLFKPAVGLLLGLSLGLLLGLPPRLLIGLHGGLPQFPAGSI